MLDDGDLEKTTKLPIPKAGESSWIQYEFAQPQTMRSLTIVTKGVDFITAMVAGIANPEKIVGSQRRWAKIPAGGEGSRGRRSRAHAFLSAGDREVFPRRVQAHASTSGAGVGERHRSRITGDQDRRASDRLRIAELALHPGARVNRFEEKAAFTPVPDLYRFRDPSRRRRMKPFQSPT